MSNKYRNLNKATKSAKCFLLGTSYFEIKSKYIESVTIQKVLTLLGKSSSRSFKLAKEYNV